MLQVLHQTIEKDLKDINSRVSEASKNLRIERVRLIKLKVKEVLGKDVDISIKDVNTDVNVHANLNDLHTTAGIVSIYSGLKILDFDFKTYYYSNKIPSNQYILFSILESCTFGNYE